MTQPQYTASVIQATQTPTRPPGTSVRDPRAAKRDGPCPLDLSPSAALDGRRSLAERILPPPFRDRYELRQRLKTRQSTNQGMACEGLAIRPT